MRILIAMMKHETNTFSPIVTDWARFESWSALTDEAVQTTYADTRMPIAAYMKLAVARGAQIVTPLAAEAMPSGKVTEQAYEHMVDRVCDALGLGCDCALLDLHGAMVAEHTPDGEGTLLERMRAIAPQLPIAVTCDLHCNLSEKMIGNSTALIGYKTYPHVDMYEVAQQIGRVLLDAMDGKCRPVTAWGHTRVLSQTLCQGTDDEPMRSLVAACRGPSAGPRSWRRPFSVASPWPTFAKPATRPSSSRTGTRISRLRFGTTCWRRPGRRERCSCIGTGP